MDINTKKKLNNGTEIPVLGLGTYLSNPGDEIITAVQAALESGYRHIDTAALYGNEFDIGTVVRDSGIPREDIFITTKVWNSDQGYKSTLTAFETSLKKLQTDYVDLYLIHWPLTDSRKETWEALLKLYDEGLCRSVGVSNYTIKHLKELLDISPVVPAVNQVEFSPFLYQKELMDFCTSHGIILESYSPLTRGKKFNNEVLRAIAAKYGKSTAQVLIRWSLQTGTVVLPKSSRPARIKENSNVFDFNLDDDDMNHLNDLNENFRVAWNPSSLD